MYFFVSATYEVYGESGYLEDVKISDIIDAEAPESAVESFEDIFGTHHICLTIRSATEGEIREYKEFLTACKYVEKGYTLDLATEIAAREHRSVDYSDNVDYND